MPGTLTSLADSAGWDRILSATRHGFTHTWAFCHAMAVTTGQEPLLWSHSSGADVLLCPIIERTAGAFTDIATPPGVSGFAGSGNCDRLRASWQEFVHERQYVAGYVCLHPVFDPGCWREHAVQYNTLYALNLQLTSAELHDAMDRNRRREVRAFAECADRLVIDRARLTRFLVDEYPGFARRVGLTGTSCWDAATVDALCAAPSTIALGVDGPHGIEAAHLYGHTPHGAEFLLQIARPEGRRHTTGLVWQAVHMLKDQGVPLLNLGGGVTDHDDIATAKRRLGAVGHPLRALRQIYDADTYKRLVAGAGDQPSQGYFPAYRRPGGRT